ncbi:aspartyl protease family protein [Inhella inkyongensis]|uniref:Aspartyl protease family protein n=1 Tax=Inhella inkyongensis TaxID=392593 RepID=A0A840S972_9BURK|nr:TIGR02281 family clan AA aspartic protease [Inhella inkyongensis]MBB5206162.1 aspartyl protease family protein [Inhella inkyongensis]
MKTALRALLFLLAASGSLAAPQVSLNGSLGQSAALLVIDGQVRTVRVGQSVGGVKLLEVGEGRAVVEAEGQRLLLQLGAAPVAQAGGGGRGGRIVLNAGPGGHFMAEGSVNGHAIQFMVDTGATTVALSMADARRMGLKLQNARQIMVGTANGTVPAYLLTLDRVRIGEVEVGGVEATVSSAPMPYALLGNSFLSRFQMKRENDVMTLERRF